MVVRDDSPRADAALATTNSTGAADGLIMPAIIMHSHHEGEPHVRSVVHGPAHGHAHRAHGLGVVIAIDICPFTADSYASNVIRTMAPSTICGERSWVVA